MEKINHSFALSPWQRRQAAMLYRYASPDYLKDVSSIITQLIDGNLTPELERQVAASYAHVMQGQQRVHNDSQLWADNSRSLLAQMQSLLAQDIRQRSGGAYRSGSLDNFFTQVVRSDAGEAYRVSDEYHVYSNLIGKYISAADNILIEHRRQQGVCDFWFAYRYADFLSDQEFIPRFRVRTDIVAASGEVPPRAGVYISIDDPNAAPQFAWPDNDRGRLTDCCTFNEIGLAALADVGRDALWFDQNKMADFFQSNGLKTPFGEQFPVSYSTIPGSVQIESKARRPCQWYFVEIEEENFEHTAMEWHRDLVSQPDQGRLAAGDACEIEGIYFAVTRVGSKQYLRVGDLAPNLELRHSRTFWQLCRLPSVQQRTLPLGFWQHLKKWWRS